LNEEQAGCYKKFKSSTNYLIYLFYCLSSKSLLSEALLCNILRKPKFLVYSANFFTWVVWAWRGFVEKEYLGCLSLERLCWKRILEPFKPKEALLKKNTWVVEPGEAFSKNTRKYSKCIILLEIVKILAVCQGLDVALDRVNQYKNSRVLISLTILYMHIYIYIYIYTYPSNRRNTVLSYLPDMFFFLKSSGWFTLSAVFNYLLLRTIWSDSCLKSQFCQNSLRKAFYTNKGRKLNSTPLLGFSRFLFQQPCLLNKGIQQKDNTVEVINRERDLLGNNLFITFEHFTQTFNLFSTSTSSLISFPWDSLGKFALSQIEDAKVDQTSQEFIILSLFLLYGFHFEISLHIFFFDYV